MVPPQPKTLPCCSPTKKTPLHKPAVELVVYDDSVMKIQGVYRKMERTMCRPCYEANSKGIRQDCRRNTLHAAEVVTKKDYKAWRTRQEGLWEMQEKMAAEEHLKQMKAGQVG